MKSSQKLDLILIIFISLTILTPFNQGATEERSKRIYSNRDSYIRDISLTSNYGGQDYLCVGQLITGFNHAFLHFNLAEIPEDITKVGLSLYCYYVPETFRLSIHTTDNSWTELGITWSNAPSEGSLVANFEIASDGHWSFIITNFMQSWSSDQISFIVKERDFSETGYIQMSSREGAATDTRKPCLIFYYEVLIPPFNPTVLIATLGGVAVIIGITVFAIQKSKSKKAKERMETSVVQSESPYHKEVSYKFCPNCGAKSEIGTFCTNCGKNLS